MEPKTINRIVIIGPESTGKSTLTEQLAAHYQTAACAEYAREYLYAHGTAYTFDDLLTIAQGQIALEEATVTKVIANATLCNLPVFIDTNMYVMKVWCEYVFGKCHQYILDQIVARPYDLYLLCNIDLPWVKDELREYPDEGPRNELYHIYKDLLVNQTTPWVHISGNYQQRLHTAICAVNQHLNMP
ncbi:MAG: AAA family ATPase [Flavobacterium sp.]|nr:AAA family ATPase [Flavobacterium sp.]